MQTLFKKLVWFNLLIASLTYADTHPVGRVVYNPGEGTGTYNPGYPTGGQNDLAWREWHRQEQEARAKKLREEALQRALDKYKAETKQAYTSWTEKHEQGASSFGAAVIVMKGQNFSNEQILNQLVDTITLKPSESSGYTFESPESPFRTLLEKQHERLYKLHYVIPRNVESKQYISREAGIFATEYADQSYKAGQMDEANFYQEIGQACLEMAVGLNPVTSVATSTYELFSGRSWITNEELSNIGRTAAFLNIATVGGAKYLSIAGKGMRAIYRGAEHILKDLRPIEDAIATGEKVIERSRNVLTKWGNHHQITHIEDAAAANARIGLSNPPYKPGTDVVHFKTGGDTTTFIRVHGRDNQARTWMVKRGEIENLTPTEIRDRLNLRDMPTHYSEAKIPANTRMSRGITNGNMWEDGRPIIDGQVQYRVEGRVQESWFSNMKEIGERLVF